MISVGKKDADNWEKRMWWMKQWSHCLIYNQPNTTSVMNDFDIQSEHANNAVLHTIPKTQWKNKAL